MAGFVIGKTLAAGFPGGVSRSGDALIECFAAKSDRIDFGAPVVFNGDGTVSVFSAGNTAAQFAGFAVRAAKQAADDTGAAYYRKGEPVDVLVRGGVCVQVASGTPACGGAVYLTADGKVSAAEDGVKLENVVFATGNMDAGGVAEVTLLTRSI